jgi:hypothetical protein
MDPRFENKIWNVVRVRYGQADKGEFERVRIFEEDIRTCPH